jgi:hypothetical protein
MDELGIPGKLTRMVRTTMENTSSSIRVQTSLSDPLDVTNGLKLACLLFNIVLQKATKDSRIQTSGHIIVKSMQIIAYADAVILTSRT